MDSKTRILTSWSFKEPDRVPIEIILSPAARKFPEAERILDFIENQADNFIGVPAGNWGFFGLKAAYREEKIEDSSPDYYRLKRIYDTAAGEFFAVTRHNYNELNPEDFHWERRYIHSLEDLERLIQASRDPVEVDIPLFEEKVERIGNRGVPKVSLFHPLGFLLRNSNLEEVFTWFHAEKKRLHQFIEKSIEQVIDFVRLLGEKGIGPVFGITAHEMLVPPWAGPNIFDEFVLPYDKSVCDTVHRYGGRVRSHCHGNCMKYLDLMCEIGIDSIEPLEPSPFGDTDLWEAKKRVGDRMLISGNVPSNLFIRMNQDEVRQCVKEAIAAAAPGGGYTLRPTSVAAGTNSAKDREQMLKFLENIQAYIDAGLEFGAYPIH